MSNTNTSSPWTWDLRVRDRNLRNGSLEVGQLEEFLAALPDVAELGTSFEVNPPNFEPPPPVVEEDEQESSDDNEE